jgi:hypothetical protein
MTDFPVDMAMDTTAADYGARWKELIGFNPVEDLGDIILEDVYTMKVWARTGVALRRLPMPKDADTGKDVPHKSVFDFDKWPMVLAPGWVLSNFLSFRNVPHPASTKRVDLERTCRDLKALIDGGGKFPIVDPANVGGNTHYVSWENLMARSVKWSSDPTVLLDTLRTSIDVVGPAYLTEVFGEKRNGVRRRAWLRFLSGHFDISTWRCADVVLKAGGAKAILFEIKCTPSMKSEVYSTYLTFSKDGGKYLAAPSRCDCPNGWLFCSHMLGLFLVIWLVQNRPNWTFEDIISAMPQPLKSIQSLPIAVGYVYGEVVQNADGVRKEQKKLGKTLASEFPNYSAEEDEVHDVQVERLAQQEVGGCGGGSVDVCAKVGEYVMKAEIRAGVNDGESKADKEYSASAVHAYNKALVEETLSPSRRREKAERHERLFQMMERGYLKKGNLLGIYVADVGNKAVRERLLEEVGSPWLKEEQFPPTLHS